MMYLKVLIAEDKEDEMLASINRCKRISKEEGFILEDKHIIKATSIDETLNYLEHEPFDFDIVILDIGFGESDLNTDKLNQYLQKDTLFESKVIIHTGNAKFKTDPEKILAAIGNGVKTIAIKGEKGINGIEKQLKRVLKDIKYEIIWANIGRFTPQWKRNLFRDDRLWNELKIGKKTEKIFMLLDISNSTQFVITQRSASIDDKHIFELFRNFANLTTNIIEEDKYKGIVERYSGDEILSYFDFIDSSKQESLISVVNCAKKIKDSFNDKIKQLYEIYSFNEIRSGQNTVQPELRILIGCGEVMWVLQGADSRPQLSIMTDKVAKFYRCFTDRDKNHNRVIKPNNIYVTHDVFIDLKNATDFEFDQPQKLDLRDFGNLNIYNLK